MSDLTAELLGNARARPHPRVDAARQDLLTLGWSRDRLGVGLQLLARAAGLVSATTAVELAAPEATTDAASWFNWAATRLGIEAEPVSATLASLESVLTRLGPGIVRLPSATGDRFLLIVQRSGRSLRLIGPDGRPAVASIAALARRLSDRFSAGVDRDIDRLIAEAGITVARRAGLRRAMVGDRLGATPIEGLWLLRLTPSASLWQQMRRVRLPHRLIAVGGLNLVGQGLELIAWGAIGASLLSGRLDTGWLTAWALLLLTMAGLRGVSGWLTALMATDFGRIVKSRLLNGALKSDADEIRASGAGHLLARMMEAQAFEMLAAGGGLAAIAALVEFIYALVLLFASGAGPLPGLALVTLAGLGTVFGLRYLQQLTRWTGTRLAITHNLVERMVGHRTLLVQERPGRRAGLDAQLADYHSGSVALDRRALPVVGGLPAVWLCIGVAAMLPAYASGALDGATLAVAIGGILFAARALSSLTESLASGARAVIAWREIGPLLSAGGRRDMPGPPVPAASAPSPGDHVVVANALTYRHGPHRVLDGVDLTISAGDRVLLTGGSGSGKSTLAGLLLGLRDPDSGQISSAAADRHHLGPQWHAHVAGAPQFHENHILSGSLAFNLLLGKRWPPTAEDLAEARDVCEELGLGDLLARMPAGLEQMVGETGWQLSHGEKSRIFLARALLQNAPLTILDESFGALDPETLSACLACVFRRAQALMVIAHP